MEEEQNCVKREMYVEKCVSHVDKEQKYVENETCKTFGKGKDICGKGIP